MRRSVRLVVVILMIWAVSTSCQKGLPQQVVAEVDGDPISAEEFTEELFPLVEGYHVPPSPQEKVALETLKEALLNQLIEKRLILTEAQKMGITVSDEELERALESIKGGYPEGGFEEFTEASEITLAQWKERLRQRLLIEKVIHRVSRVTAPIDEATLRAYYEGHREEFAVSEQVRARHIVVQDRKDAQAILSKLREGESFEKLVRGYSTGPEAEEGGDLGFFARREMPEEFEVVFSLKVGEISDIVQSPYGYHIFQVVDKRGTSELGFTDVKGQIRERIVREQEEKTFQNWLAGITKKAKIRVNQRTLKEIGPPIPKRERARE